MSIIYGNTVGSNVPQSDWNQTDDTKADYIKNKPTTLGDAELVDIRVAADGTTYETAGEAVRAQVSGLNNALIEKADELKSDLAGKVQKKDYAPETKTESMTQPVGKDENGKLWTTVPDKISAFENDAGYLTEHQDISGKLDADKLQEAVNYALEQAKISGAFDGADGRPGENGTDGYSPSANVTQNDNGATITITDKNGTTTATVTNGKDGAPGADGKTPEYGVDYGTPEQIQGIAQSAAELLELDVSQLKSDITDLQNALIGVSDLIGGDA